MSRTPAGVQKVCAKEVRAHFSFPILRKRSIWEAQIFTENRRKPQRILQNPFVPLSLSLLIPPNLRIMSGFCFDFLWYL